MTDFDAAGAWSCCARRPNSAAFGMAGAPRGPLKFTTAARVIRKALAPALLTAAFLTACGGGGGGGGGGTATAPAVVAPTIHTQPASTMVNEDTTASFFVGASGTSPLAYQWRRNGNDIAGATGQILNLPAITPADDGHKFSVVVTNAAGSAFSNDAVLTVIRTLSAPSITAQPMGATVTPGGTATFTVRATGWPTPSFVWRLNGTGLSTAPLLLGNDGPMTSGPCFGTVVSGANTPTLTLSNIAASCGGLTISVQVGNPQGFVNSAAALISTRPAFTQVCTKPNAAGWCWVSPSPEGAALLDVRFPSPNVGVALGFAGRVYRSVDAGQTWSVVDTPSTRTLRAIAFSDATNGLAVGEGGIIIRTTDAGQTWTAVASGTTLDLGTVAYASATVVYAAAAFTPSLLRSTDAGQTWSLADPTIRGLNMAFASPTVGVVVNGVGTFRTTDGLTWNPVGPLPAADFPSGVAFATPTVGVMVGQNGRIYRTTDAGANWVVVPSGTSTHLSRVAFTSATVGIATGSQVILRTEDGGLTWQTVVSQQQAFLQAVAFADATTAVVAGSSGWFLRSTDAGKTWTELSSRLPGREHLSSVAFATGTTVVAVGLSGRIARSLDDGQRWQTLDNTGGHPLNSVAFSGADTGVSVGDAGTIRRSTNAGAAWTAVASGTQKRLNAVTFASAMTAVAVGEEGIVLRSSDGGQTWAAINSGTAVDLHAVAFSTPTVGLAVGSATIIRTTDGGQTWSGVPSTPAQFLRAVAFAGNIGVVVGGGGYIGRSTDAGATWTAVPSTTVSNLIAVAFASAGKATAVGESGALLLSSDYGTTWTSPHPLLDDVLLGVAYRPGSDLGVIVGATFTPVILRTTTAGQ